MSFQALCAVLATIIGILCSLPYIVDTIGRRTEPHAYSWLVWSTLQLTGVAAMWKAGAGAAVLSPFVGALICGTIFLLSLRYGSRNIKYIDKICLAGAGCAFAVYLIEDNPLFCVSMVTITDFIGCLPTFRKSWEEPWTETARTYGWSAVCCALSLAALSAVNLTTTLYLVCLLLTNAALASTIVLRRRTIEAPAQPAPQRTSAEA